MSKRLVDILPKIPQYEDIPYAGDLNCPHCDKSGFYEYDWNRTEKLLPPKVIGWCETNIGYMAVFECPCCGNKFRFHTTIGSWIAPIEEFDFYLYYKAKRCSNWPELKKQLGDDDDDDV